MAYRYFIKLAYNGSAYSGWQNQPNAITVQHWMENGLSVICGVNTVTGCGRTDAGVHAEEFYAHFDHENSFTQTELDQFKFRMNRFLPQDVVVFSILPVVLGAHARYSALWRQYEYVIARQKDPFRFDRAYFVPGELNTKKMNDLAEIMIGRHDFQCFSKVNTQVNNYLCDIHSVAWVEEGHLLKLSIRADRFLRNMVRAIVGTLLEAGRGKISEQAFHEILNSHSRSKAGCSVPAKGLTLTKVGYPAEVFSDKPVFFETGSREKIISHFYNIDKPIETDSNKSKE